MPVYTDPICLLYRVFHETQTAMAMAVVVTMVATVVGAVVHAVKVRISVPSLFCIPERVLYFISKIPISKFTFIHQIFFINHTTLHLIFVYVIPSSFPFIFFLKYVCTCTCEHMKFFTFIVTILIRINFQQLWIYIIKCICIQILYFYIIFNNIFILFFLIILYT